MSFPDLPLPYFPVSLKTLVIVCHYLLELPLTNSFPISYLGIKSLLRYSQSPSLTKKLDHMIHKSDDQTKAIVQNCFQDGTNKD